MTDNVYTSGTVAAAVGLPRWKLVYLIERDVLPRPSYQVPGRRLFVEADITAILKVLDAKPSLREPVWNRDQ